MRGCLSGWTATIEGRPGEELLAAVEKLWREARAGASWTSTGRSPEERPAPVGAQPAGTPSARAAARAITSSTSAVKSRSALAVKYPKRRPRGTVYPDRIEACTESTLHGYERIDSGSVDRVPRDIEVIHALQIEPELGSHAEGSPDAQRGVRGDGPAAVDDLVDAPGCNADRLRQTVLADPELLEDLGQVLSGVNRLGHD